MHVLITGASGYVGSVLSPMIREAGHRVTALDTMWFGNHLGPSARRYRIRKGDVRDGIHGFDTVDAIIHLAAVSNDESVEADQELSRSINLDATRALVHSASSLRIKRLIFASTSAVYGHSPQPMQLGDPCEPIFNYAKWKLEAERSVIDAGYTVVRPAALFGHSPRMRFDLGVNILTAHAVAKGRIEVWGGEQMRSTLHVHDMAYAYCQLLRAPLEHIRAKIFNIGGENQTVQQLAERVQAVTGALIYKTDAKDTRSYQIDSSAWRQLFGAPRRTIEDGIAEIVANIKADCYSDPLGNDLYHNVRWMRRWLAA
jgi:nucleoside-diphosphate-sugar epimerase